MQGLLAHAWVSQALGAVKIFSPKDPNLLDRTFGKYADRELTDHNQLDLALLMLGVMLVALVWRMVRTRLDLKRLAPPLDEQLSKEKTITWLERTITAALVVVALLASVNYFYGTRNNGIYVHRWDAFHTVIGVKYHQELGHFDLYKCAYAIDREGPHHFRSSKEIRNLATRKLEPRDQIIAGNDCKEKFTPERLEEFKHDLDQFGQWSDKSQWRILFQDKGFNGTPFYATVCKLLIGMVDISIEGLKKLAVIDPVLMMIGFGFVGWAFGARKAAILAIFFCVFFPNRFTHMGGSILRFDYVAALLIGFSALKKDKWGLAGVMFAWATMVRVFPAIFAVGVGFKILADVVSDWGSTRDRPVKEWLRPEHWRFVIFALGGLAVFFLISLVGMKGGFSNWQLWAENMKVHNARSAAFRIGFRHLFMADGKLTGNDFGLKQANFVARENYYWIAALALFAPVVISVRKLDIVSFGVIFGVFGFFLFSFATRYYYGVVALLFLIDREPLKNRYMMIMGAMLFLATAIDFAYFAINNNDPLMYNTILGIELTVVIAVMGSWLLFNPSLIDLGDDPRLPARVPAQLYGPPPEAKPAAKPDAKPVTEAKPEPEPEPAAKPEGDAEASPGASS